MEECNNCREPARLRVFVRPQEGGPRKARHFCCVECKSTGLKDLSVQGLKETDEVLGWDVFIPMWTR